MSVPAPPCIVVSPTVPVAVTVQPTSPGQVTISPAGLPGPAGGPMAYAISPFVVTLADAATIYVNATLGNYFRVTLGGDRILASPSGAADAQQITFEIVQPASGGPWTVTWGAAYEFSGSAVPEPVLSTAPGARDLAGFVYNAVSGNWMCVAALTGF